MKARLMAVDSSTAEALLCFTMVVLVSNLDIVGLKTFTSSVCCFDSRMFYYSYVLERGEYQNWEVAIVYGDIMLSYLIGTLKSFSWTSLLNELIRTI